jgi:CHAT domain-containing protein
MARLRITEHGDKIRFWLNDVVGVCDNYVPHKVSMPLIRKMTDKMFGIVKKVDSNGEVSTNDYSIFMEQARLLYDYVLPKEVKEWISDQDSRCPFWLMMDDKLVEIPWELLHDGEMMLGLRYSMGRYVNTPIKSYRIKKRSVIPIPSKLMAVGHVTDNLEAVAGEVSAIRNILEPEKDVIEVTTSTRNINKEFVKLALRDYDVFHFAGHSLKSKWILSDGKLGPDDIEKIVAPSQTMPIVVFANTCSSGKIVSKNEEKETYNIAYAFILAGVCCYIGSLWKIIDGQAKAFAEMFYKSLFYPRETIEETFLETELDLYTGKETQGVRKKRKYVERGSTVGLALRDARREYIKCFGEKSLMWAAYVLYGDPTISLSSFDCLL